MAHQPRGVGKGLGFFAERNKRCDGSRNYLVEMVPCRLDTEQADERRLASRSVFSCCFADIGGCAYGIE